MTGQKGLFVKEHILGGQDDRKAFVKLSITCSEQWHVSQALSSLVIVTLTSL